MKFSTEHTRDARNSAWYLFSCAPCFVHSNFKKILNTTLTSIIHGQFIMNIRKMNHLFTVFKNSNKTRLPRYPWIGVKSSFNTKIRLTFTTYINTHTTTRRYWVGYEKRKNPRGVFSKRIYTLNHSSSVCIKNKSLVFKLFRIYERITTHRRERILDYLFAFFPAVSFPSLAHKLAAPAYLRGRKPPVRRLALKGGEPFLMVYLFYKLGLRCAALRKLLCMAHKSCRTVLLSTALHYTHKNGNPRDESLNVSKTPPPYNPTTSINIRKLCLHAFPIISFITYRFYKQLCLVDDPIIKLTPAMFFFFLFNQNEQNITKKSFKPRPFSD